jgi:hypothetical protein
LNLNSHASFFTLTNVRSNQAGNYRVVVTNAAQASLIASRNATLTVLADTDRDGMPDAWESQYGFDPGSGADAESDPDGDTMKNWQEYVAGTDPADGQSYLKVDRCAPEGRGATLQFQAVSNRTYTVEYAEALGTAPWLALTNLVALTNSRLETVVDPSAGANRFYRLVTPARLE